MTDKQQLALLALELWIRDPKELERLDPSLIPLAEKAAGRDLCKKPAQMVGQWIKRAPSCPSWPHLKTQEIHERLWKLAH